LLNRLVKQLFDDFHLTPKFAFELEFYAIDNNLENVKSILAANEYIESINYEEGEGQFEITSIIQETRNIINVYQITSKIFLKYNFNKKAKPFPNQPASGLHLHVHLEDNAGNNTYRKSDDSISYVLAHSLSGILSVLNESMLFYAPTPESYLRFEDKQHVPHTISWGANNRTTAIRLPSTSKSNSKHIELRVAGADAHFEYTLASMLIGLHYGLSNKPTLPEQIYGDANHEKYNLPLLPQRYEQAAEAFDSAKILPQYLKENELAAFQAISLQQSA
jgi:glutamine synthetase